MRRQDMTCANCLDSFNLTTIRYAMDHLIPVWHGAEDIAQNRQALCQDCHNPKGTMTLQQWNDAKSAIAIAARARRMLRRDFYPTIEKDRLLWHGIEYPFVPINWNRRHPMLRRNNLNQSQGEMRSSMG